MSVSCVIRLDSSSRTENLVNDSLCGLFSRFPRGQTQGIFVYVSFAFFFLPSSNKDAVTGGGFSAEPVCHVFALMRSQHESLFA